MNSLILSQFWLLQVWRSVSRGFFLPTCLSFLRPSQRETKCPTSPPVSPLTPPWWWASCLYVILSVSPSLCRSWSLTVHHLFVFMCVCVCVYIRWVAEGSGSSAEMSGQEESGSGAGRQQCWSSYPAVPRLHAVTHILMLLCTHIPIGLWLHIFRNEEPWKSFVNEGSFFYCSAFSYTVFSLLALCFILNAHWLYYISSIISTSRLNLSCVMRKFSWMKMMLLWNVHCFFPIQ